MEANTSSPIIIKLGGSVISHSNKIVDYNFLREFRDLLQEQILLGKRFVLIVGGGQTCREFIEHARENGNITDETDLHWIGTAVNTLNAEMVRSFLGEEITEPQVWKYEDKNRIAELSFEKPIAVAGGFEAGKSGDWVALKIAEALKVTQVLDLKNVDAVYDKDPRGNADAKSFPLLNWADYLKLIGNPSSHKPGDSLPVDSIAAAEAQKLGVKYYIIKATDLDNVEAAIAGREFKGTIISD